MYSKPTTQWPSSRSAASVDGQMTPLEEDCQAIGRAPARKRRAADGNTSARPPRRQNNIPDKRGGERLMTPENRADYWKANLRLLITLLIIWFLVSYGFGIILVDVLNSFSLGGYKLGFWFAQQGSIYTFLVLIFVYAVRMNQLDKKFDVHED
jgi:putative solute:sodium symporter small subunit